MDQYIRTISDSHSSSEVIDDSDLGPSQRTVEADDGVVIGSTNATEEAPQEVLPTGHLVAEEDEEDMEEDDEEDEYEYEDEDDVGLSSFLVDNPAFAASATVQDDKKPTRIEEEQQEPPKQKWRQPLKEAVSLSLQAEKVKSGGRRRLLQDLSKIMSEDNDEAGFKIKPSDEDSMDKWTVKLFKFDEDSNLAKDMKDLGLTNIELEFTFPEQYPFEPPFVRMLRPRFKRQTGFVMNGALCMELLTKDGWNPINDIESVIVSIRSLLVVGDGRLEAATKLSEDEYKSRLESFESGSPNKRKRMAEDSQHTLSQGGTYTVSEAEAAHQHLTSYHKKKGWDSMGWWAKKG